MIAIIDESKMTLKFYPDNKRKEIKSLHLKRVYYAAYQLVASVEDFVGHYTFDFDKDLVFNPADMAEYKIKSYIKTGKLHEFKLLDLTFLWENQ